jgi:ferredoxin
MILEAAAAALAGGATASWLAAARSAARVDRLLGGAADLLDDLRRARCESVDRVNEVRAALRRLDDKPVHRVRVLPTGETLVPFREAQVVLDLAWENGIKIPSACGGCAECGTCRVRVLEGLEGLPPKSPKEKRTLSMYTFDADVRLACLLRIHRDLVVRPEVDQDQFPVVVPPPSSSDSTATSSPSSQ